MTQMIKTKTHKHDLICNVGGLIALLLLLTIPMNAVAQIVIGGNVYGGGNEGNLGGSTKVTVRGGDIHKVFGGARQANVGGSAFVHIDGENSSSPYVVIDKVYGGNDIAGTVGTSAAPPSELTAKVENNIDNTWNTFVRLSTKLDGEGDPDPGQKTYIGQLFAGGNGDYFYRNEGDTHEIYNSEQDYLDGRDPIASNSTGFTLPDINKAYLEVCGGSIVYAYGGGNNVTVKNASVIHVDNPSLVVNSIIDTNNPNANTDPEKGAIGQLLTNDRFRLQMDINTGFSKPSSDEFQIGRLFGGNNKADMAIRPLWNLKSGLVRNIYSGGNKGRMTNPEGILLEIREDSRLVSDNVYGGCRMADVRPMKNGVDVASNEIQLTDPTYKFPAGFAARILVRGGDINNVYGGNDITGRVYGGDAVGVYSSIRGDVYGGGNGSYPYTDNLKMKDHDIYGDLYYSVPDGKTSAQALLDFRPNTEQVSLRLMGKENLKTIIGGSVYVGGNSATLKKRSDGSSQTVELKIGSYVIADNVFLGNNGENMIKYNEGVGGDEGVLRTLVRTDIPALEGSKYNSMDLTDADQFSSYMDGCAMNLRPTIVFDSEDRGDPANYENYTTYFGSLFGGGNVGSMVMEGKEILDFTKEVIIFNKLVGGCNNADIPATAYNAAYKGGVIGTVAERESYTDGDKMKDRLELNLSGVKLVPMRWKVKVLASQPTVGDDVAGKAVMDEQGVVTMLPAGSKAKSGVTYYDFDLNAYGQTQLEFNVFSRSLQSAIIGLNPSSLPTGTSTATDLDRRLMGANIYGGCYNSGHVNGNVVINLNGSIHDRNVVFDEVEATAKRYGNETYNILTRHSGVLRDEQGMDALGSALNVFGGGFGEDSEVWGSTTVNLNKGYTFQIFGGGEMGAIGKGVWNALTNKYDYSYDAKYSTCVNLNGTTAGDATTNVETMPECEFIYGGSFEAPIAGNTQINLGNGRIFNSFAGSCNADIYGHTETYMGRGSSSDAIQGFPWVIDHIYGGNDLGGTIHGIADFTGRVREAARPKIYGYNAESTPKAQVTQASAYIEYQQGRVEYIFGGAYGDYDYNDGGEYASYRSVKPYLQNAFVYFRPSVDNSNNRVERIFGAGQGISDGVVKNFHQDRSYVLVDVPQTMTSFTTTEVFGAGSFGGIGMGVTKATADENANGVEASAVIDLIRGQISAAYGGSYNQGVTRRSIVNVPTGSTIAINNVFGGAYGTSEGTADNKKPCDVYQSIVNYSSSNARVNYLYGGNNSYRRTLFTQVNVNATVTMKSNPAYLGYAYGAGYGENTWAQYTEVNINNGGLVYEAYGGGNAGKVLNEKSLDKWNAGLSAENKIGRALDGTGYTDVNYMENSIAKVSQLYTDLNGKYGKTYDQKYNTNVHIFLGGEASNYSYGGGYGATAVVSGTTYFDVLGGKVGKDIYGAGTRGSVEDLYKDKTFTAGTNIYISGGSVRNVYGGGWEGNVGYHNSETTETTDDVLGETHVVIGNTNALATYFNGAPVIQRNAYGAGEGGAVYGTTNITLYNGYVGYYFDTETDKYVEKLDDETHSDGIGKDLLKEAGNIFGSGYADYSNADNAYVTIYGGNVRNSVYGAGEIGTIGRGLTDGTVHKGGESHVEMYDGHVFHDVFGGGRGYDNLNRVSAIGTSGYVFGSTEVLIHGGEIGTESGMALGYGNVFGGGNIGYVYSSKGEKSLTDGYYYDAEDKLTEDCRVVIKPYCKVKTAYDTYAVGDFVPTDVLDTYPFNDAKWANLDNAGITVHNAVFAGGNVSAGSDRVYANTKTVFGNATASIIDLFDEDLITIGDDGIGGLYGDGNLTFVDGYRELNITNYGTDYNHLNSSLTYEQYQELNKRQQAYYELKYKAQATHVYSFYMSTNTHTYDETLYRKGQKITASDYASLTPEEKANWKTGTISYEKDEQITENEFDLMDATEQANWDLYGFCTLFEGRMINTLQRADFCGVFGSRIVLRGAQDRVPSEVDYTEYTINRIDELSLNKIENSHVSAETKTNGNYFGIYNVVNYLGALTSDVDFKESVRKTDSSDYPADGKTFYGWKEANLGKRSRNNGKCHNEVSLASGVWLEILDKSTETAGEKVYGPITGVVQLNLINVATGEGGGYVYAKNQHGELISKSATGQNTLADANDNAISYKQYTYKTTDLIAMETSGNFINPLKRIIDDCYPKSGAYKGEGASPAHYWFIRGEYYVYDQYISAYTGSTQAYAEVVSIPLTITAEAQGKLELESVYKNLYAYWDDANLLPKYKSKVDENAIVVGGVTYHKNEPISYWAWSHLTEAEKELFVSDETFVCSNTATYNNVTYTAGDVYTTKPADIYVCVAHGDDEHPEGTVITSTQYDALSETDKSKYAVVFNRSNVVSHSNGFVLTFDWNNPDVWNDYYHQVTGSDKVPSSRYNTMPSGYITSPSYICHTPGVFGQRNYSLGDLIDEAYYNMQSALGSHTPTEGQGQFDRAYVAKDNCQFVDHETNHQYVKGACIREAEYNALEEGNKALFEAGMICNDTYSKSETEYYLYGEVIPLSEYNELLDVDASVSTHFSKGYICYTAGLWGGEYYAANTNYPAIKYSNLSEAERANFTFNYDAFDVLIDENYQNNTALYDSKDGSAGKILYAKRQSIDYTATYKGDGIILTNSVDITRGGEPQNTNELEYNDVLQNTVYESLINYQYNYTPIVVLASDIHDNYYVVKEDFQIGDKAYLVGNQLSKAEYDDLGDNKIKIQVIPKSDLNAVDELPTGADQKRYYFCNKEYTSDAAHSIGELISSDTYTSLKNEQKSFEIDGLIPSETSTLYVAREANIDQLSKDRIITVSYWYDYIEKDDSGLSYENVREKHVVNIHVHFESGVPTIGELLPPATVLPSDVLSLNQPTVTKGAYEILGGGWEIFTNEDDAVKHQNGEHYTNYITPMYWYQNEYYVAYYAKSYLGKTYSNPVKISVANYHDLDAVMSDKEHHMYVDHPLVKRNSKIYIDNRDCESDPTASELDLLKDLYDLSLLDESSDEVTDGVVTAEGALTGHAILDTHVKSCQNLDFILRSEVSPKKYTDWTSIGNSECFAGTVHGDGYTVSGLNNSLFNKLCGDIYNLGVSGTFTSAGIAETGAGYMENCWAATTNTAAKTTKPVFGNPNGSGYQMVNCYYMEDDDATNKYINHSGSYGIPTRKTSQAFYNGEVAYDLNGFYLYKRYNDGKGVSTGTGYKYYTFASDGTISAPQTSHYESHVSECSSGYEGSKYVEDRFANNDFIYAAGNIPEGENVRYSVDDAQYYPIWPDDYIFFGQMLTYGHVDDQAHQSLPSHIIKAADRIQIAKGNRVYRAPAYFQSKQMGIAHFNPDAILAAKSKDKTRDAYPGMTAIDFSGYNDLSHGYQLGAKSTAPYDNIRDGGFYPPLLDDDGLHSIANMDLTKNLLVYIPQATTEATTKTYDVVTDYLPDATYAETNATYRTVATSTATINGHRVVDTGEGYTAPVDHLLVDKQDFNAPISYTFASGKRMWYQRRPDLYVNTNRGWEGISIPFAAELVTTQDKGEITHFYETSTSGHEYWLRGLVSGGEISTENAAIYLAKFEYPKKGSVKKNYTNTFLWDYYYSKYDRKDANTDKYQQEDDRQKYYIESRTYENYPYNGAATPYIIGFPSNRYYEFDLSGSFIPENTFNSIDRLPQQTITFASKPAITIAVSDDEMASAATSDTKYIFTPNYLSKLQAAGVFMMNGEGNAYQVTVDPTAAVPFRPYFTSAPSSAKRFKAAQYIVFDEGVSFDIESPFVEEKSEPMAEELDEGELTFFGQGHNIISKSSLTRDADVHIYNTNGVIIANFTIHTDETISLPASAGVYIINADRGRVVKKLIVK